MGGESIIEVTDSNFEQEVAGASELVLVDFWAPWCGPCRMITPVIEKIAAQYSDRMKTGKLLTDENQATSVKYGVMSIPTLIFFKEGKEVDRSIGVVSEQELKEKIDKLL
ncbi:MAG: thioredoxin [bacterium]|nr:thioredoxin [bacterium]